LFFFYPSFFPVIEAVIDKLILIFFGSILQNKDTIKYRIIERQINMDKPNGKSFASLVYDKLNRVVPGFVYIFFAEVSLIG
jgi:hypothetical protein